MRVISQWSSSNVYLDSWQGGAEKAQYRWRLNFELVSEGRESQLKEENTDFKKRGGGCEN